TQAPGVLIACHGICACGQRGMDGVVPVAPYAFLGAFAIEFECQREDAALSHEAGGGGDISGGDVIERTDLVVMPPLAPVAAAFGSFVNQIDREFVFVVAMDHGTVSCLLVDQPII